MHPLDETHGRDAFRRSVQAGDRDDAAAVAGRTPTEVRRARDHLLQNARKHYGLTVPDPYTSTVAVIAPETFLLRRLC